MRGKQKTIVSFNFPFAETAILGRYDAECEYVYCDYEQHQTQTPARGLGLGLFPVSWLGFSFFLFRAQGSGRRSGLGLLFGCLKTPGYLE